MPITQSSVTPSASSDITNNSVVRKESDAAAPTKNYPPPHTPYPPTRPKKQPISALATQLRALQEEKHSQSSEIAHLKRQVQLLSEFKGFSVDGRTADVRLRRELLEAQELEQHLQKLQQHQHQQHQHQQHQYQQQHSENITASSFHTPTKATNNFNYKNNKMDPINNNSTNSNANHGDENDRLASANSTESNASANSANYPPLLHLSSDKNNKYDDYSEEALEEFAKIASPMVSELLNEQALVLDDLLMDTKAWSTGGHGGSMSDSDSDYSSEYEYATSDLRDKLDDAASMSASQIPGLPKNPQNQKKARRKKKKRGNKKSKSRLGANDDDDEDSMNEEWDQLEAAQLNLKDELEAAAHGFDQMMYANEEEDDDDDEYVIADGGEAGVANAYTEEWNDSIHQYYMENNNSHNSANQQQPNNIPLSPAPASYTLADHARTLDVSRPPDHRNLYIKPLLSHHDLQTLSILTMPDWIQHPSGSSSRTRERYMKRILESVVEYIEPPKSRTLRRLYSGWNPGPGERKPEDDQGGERVEVHRNGGVGGMQVASGGSGGGDGGGAQRVMAYSPTRANSKEDDGESSAEEEDGGFEDVDGTMAYTAKKRRVMEPLPVRTVTVRIRPDVLCGAVMDALTSSVERVGGEMTKRQGGHLRAILPGRKMRVWSPGEREKERMNKIREQNDATNFQEIQAPSHADNDDISSVTSGISSMLSLSPMLGTSSRNINKGPKYDVLPPSIVDAQLVTKKVGKECQRLVLIRMYRVQDVARATMMEGGGGESNDMEAYDVIAPIDCTDDDIGGSMQQQHDGEQQNANNSAAPGTPVVDTLLESKRSLKALQEASALVQRIKAVGGSGFAIDPPPPPALDGDTASVASHTSTKSYLKSFGDAIVSPMRYFGSTTTTNNTNGTADMLAQMKSNAISSSSSPYPTVMELMSNELLRKNISSPSVGTPSKSALSAAKKKSHGIYPSLSMEDVPYVKSSWIFLRDCIEELDRRCLAYSTLGTNPIFQFPALPTIDVHFIAQIKAFCRESMIVSLVKTASELEIYAREFEVSCGNVEQLLRPTFEMYKLAPPQLPVPVPLTAYPLDFRPPEEISPPWGPDVKTALEEITNEFAAIPSTENNDQTQNHQNQNNTLLSFQRSEKAIHLIVVAFQKQNDVEQGARLGRKNMQVMDRLAKMQAQKRNSIAKIRCSYGTNLLATRAGDEFHSLRQKSSNVGSLTDVINAVPDEVPLLMCNVLVGNAAGTCYVTHAHILFNTQLVPILGGNKVHLFSIMDVEVTINAPKKSMLSPLPASISLTTAVFGGKKRGGTREEVYNFIPSIGARRFAKFLEVLKDNLLEDPNSLKFSEKGGLIYLADC